MYATEKDSTIDGKIIGELFRKYRKEKHAEDCKWTQGFVAEKAYVDYGHYGKFERGEKKEPQFVTIGKLAKALEVSLDRVWEDYLKEKEQYVEKE